MLPALGRRAINLLQRLGHSAFFLLDLVRNTPTALRRFYLVIAQVHAIGNYSLVIIAASGLAVGFVLALQGYYTLSRYGAAESLGLLVALSLVRELGPVVTGLLFAGRAGTSLTAEIGLMKAGEQLAAMEMMAVDPKSRVLAPRFVAGAISMPLLAAIFSAVGIMGGYVVGVLMIGIDPGAFWSQMQSGVDVWDDVGNGIIKSVVFGVACTFIALYQGYEAEATPEGVSQATTRTVVISSLAVLGLDFVLTALMFSTPR
ncbi:MAG TPA: lipid asymmetry maintenance ABC transporter permease subunit MlaE [Burkholderiaceae bacterium]|nr:lipid asymmetry maintenance ABC transporter permease subunit MlaE [Burkholderiaceae bacterium]